MSTVSIINIYFSIKIFKIMKHMVIFAKAKEMMKYLGIKLSRNL